MQTLLKGERTCKTCQTWWACVLHQNQLNCHTHSGEMRAGKRFHVSWCFQTKYLNFFFKLSKSLKILLTDITKKSPTTRLNWKRKQPTAWLALRSTVCLHLRRCGKQHLKIKRIFSIWNRKPQVWVETWTEGLTCTEIIQVLSHLQVLTEQTPADQAPPLLSTKVQ